MAIVWQGAGYRDIMVCDTENGLKLSSVVDYHDGTIQAEETVELPKPDRWVLIKAFGAGMPEKHLSRWELAENRHLDIYGAACGNMGDWMIGEGRQVLLRGSGNFEGLTKALENPDELEG